ncbi:MAG: type III PLP-dependent enzyme [Waterburya sp.]
MRNLPHFPNALSLVETLKPNYSFYCLRPQILTDTAKRFIDLFPGQVMYAVKCNSHPLVIDGLYQGGIKKFNAASIFEIAQISNAYLNSQIYFMHLVKSFTAIKSAYWDFGVNRFAVDDYNELEKILEATGGRNLTILVKIKIPPLEGSSYNIAKKFGAEPLVAARLMQQAAQAGCRVGVSFDIASQYIEPQAYGKALDLVGGVIKMAGVEPVCINIGYGFPVAYPGKDILSLEDYIAEIEQGLQRLNLSPDVEILAEPSQALVSSGCSLLTQVQLRNEEQLFIKDSVYSASSELLDSQNTLLTRVIRLNGSVSNELKEFSVAGMTGDSNHMLSFPRRLPVDVKEGDWLEIDCVDASANGLSTRFNNFYTNAFAILDDAPPSLVTQTQIKPVLVGAAN